MYGVIKKCTPVRVQVLVRRLLYSRRGRISIVQASADGNRGYTYAAPVGASDRINSVYLHRRLVQAIHASFELQVSKIDIFANSGRRTLAALVSSFDRFLGSICWLSFAMGCLAWILFPALLGLCCGMPMAHARLSRETTSQVVEGASIDIHVPSCVAASGVGRGRDGPRCIHLTAVPPSFKLIF